MATNSLPFALYLDVAGKQNYIFSSNLLRENIGASFIIEEELYKTCILSTLNSVFPQGSVNKDLLENWGKIENEENQLLEVVFLGGGNGLLLFSKKEHAIEFVKQFSLKVLINFPGLQLVTALIDDFDASDWQGSRKKIIQKLEENRSLHNVNFKPFKHGVFKDCPYSGEGQETFDPALKKWVSFQTKIKIDAAKKAQEDFEKTFDLKDIELTNQIEELNGSDDKGYVAVVHIDGNGLGQKFSSINSIHEFQKYSKVVNNKLIESLNVLIQDLVEILKLNKDHNNFLQLIEKNKKYVLPFRSIINAGDDITFVCHGALGLYLATKYVSILNDATIGGEAIPSCAGVAIVNKKYPFYRAYKLAEELTKEAKVESRKDATNNTCWLNFHISSGGYTGDFEELIKRKYIINGQKVPRGPYSLDSKDQHWRSFSFLSQSLKSLLYPQASSEAFPKNKLNEIKHSLSQTEEERRLLVLLLGEKADRLPTKNFLQFPYFDLVEMIEFFPEQILNRYV